VTVVRVGVTGHRDLADPALVASQIDDVLERLSEHAVAEGADAPVAFTCVSGLAEGADRLVADRVLARTGGRLEAILPLEIDDYAADFADDASRQTFNDLLVAADQVTVMPPDPTDASREAAYERAGAAMVLSSDVLLALWDGEASRGRGGTAEMVAEAERLGVSVEVVPVERAAR
jgi:hypothetical protein